MRISVCAVNPVARRFLLISLSSASLLVLPVRGDENYFGYSYGSETLPKGKWELYSWTTGRFGKGTGSYSAFDRKQEVEYGITDRFQIALEWKENHTYFTCGAGQEKADSNTLSVCPFRSSSFPSLPPLVTNQPDWPLYRL